MLPFVGLPTSQLEDTLVLDGTLVVETPPKNENGGRVRVRLPEERVGVKDGDVVVFEDMGSPDEHRLAMHGFASMWREGWTFFALHSLGVFRGVVALEGGEHRELARGVGRALEFAAAQPFSTRGSFNSYRLLSDEESDAFFSLMGVGGPGPGPAPQRRVGVRRALTRDAERSAGEAYMSLHAASLGIGPVVHAAGLVDGKSVYVVDAHTPLASLMRRRTINDQRLPPRPALRGLDEAVGAAFAKVAQSGLLMLDSKADNVVVDLSGDTPVVLAIDFDDQFCAYLSKDQASCVFVVNATMFLLSIQETCVRDGAEDNKENYRPIADLQRRLRLAMTSLDSKGLCDVLSRRLFHERRYPPWKLSATNVDKLARVVVFLANQYARFDGGAYDHLKCPIDGLSFDAPIWPQLVKHVLLDMKPTPVGDDDFTDELRRAMETPLN